MRAPSTKTGSRVEHGLKLSSTRPSAKSNTHRDLDGRHLCRSRAVCSQHNMALSVLLPALSPSTVHDACEQYVENLLSALQDFLQHNPASNVVCGMDAHDPASQILAKKLGASSSRLRVRCYTFQDQALHEAKQTGLDFCHWIAKPYKRYTPICWMWQQLAICAQCNFQPEASVLLGDDIRVTPAKWVGQVLGGAA